MALTKEDHRRLSRQCAEILSLLELRPRTNAEFAAVALKSLVHVIGGQLALAGMA